MTRRPCPHLLLRLLIVFLVLIGWAAAVAAGPTILHPRGVIEGHYIVVLEPAAGAPAAVARELAQTHQFEVGFVYSHALKGFSAALPPAAAAALARNPLVRSIEPDRTVQIMNQTVPTGIERIFALDNPSLTIDGVDDRRVDVDVAVLDTGIDAGHPDLNVVASVDCSGGNPFRGNCESGGTDGNGHGTHVAGTIAAIDNNIGVVGVAPGARLWSVKVLADNGSGYLSWIIAGIDWITYRAETITVANMSLGFEGSSDAFNEAITKSVAAGITYAVAAGNSGKDAATFSPASHPDVITVSALADGDGLPGGLVDPTCLVDEDDDTLANFSNFGAVINLAAPGVCIYSTWPGGAYRTISGTSMAAPHVAGAAAILVASGTSVPAEVRAALQNAGNYYWTDTSGDCCHEPLLDVGDSDLFAPAMVAGSETGPTEPEVSVTITSPHEGESYPTGNDIYFAAIADEGVDLADLQWTSSLVDGTIGTGANFTTQLSELGDHTITAQLDDPVVSSSVNITVYEEIAAGSLAVAGITYATDGGRNKDRHLTVTVTVHDADGQPAGEVKVAVEINNIDNGATWTGTATTSAAGKAAFAINNHPDGCYTTTVLTLNGTPPVGYVDEGYCKNK